MKRMIVILLVAASLLTMTAGVFADPNHAGIELFSTEQVTPLGE